MTKANGIHIMREEDLVRHRINNYCCKCNISIQVGDKYVSHRSNWGRTLRRYCIDCAKELNIIE